MIPSIHRAASSCCTVLGQRVGRLTYACWPLVATQAHTHFGSCDFSHNDTFRPEIFGVLERYPAGWSSKPARYSALPNLLRRLSQPSGASLFLCASDVTRATPHSSNRCSAARLGGLL